MAAVHPTLHDAQVPEFGLVPALRWHASVFSERTGIKVATRAMGAPARLLRDAGLALFRIVQETLTNLAKHSGAGNVKVAIHYGDGVSDIEDLASLVKFAIRHGVTSVE